MGKVHFFFWVFVLSLFKPSPLFAHPLINEVFPVGSDDWVEIYNPQTEPAVDLSLYLLRDSSKTNKVSLTGSLPPGGYAVFAFGNKLNNGGDVVKLLQNSDNEVIDEVSYGKGTDCAVKENQSIGRNASKQLVIFVSPTKGQLNTEGTSCQKETLPSSVEKITPPTAVPRIEETSTNIEEHVLASEAEEKTPLPSNSPLPEPSSAESLPSLSPIPEVNSSPVLGNAFIVAGCICVVIAVGGFLLIFKKRYNEKHAQETS